MFRLYRISLFLFLAVVLFIQPAQAAKFKTIDQAAPHFAGLQGTFVLYDELADQYSIFNEKQSNKRLTPCSSFKIYNSLIALETGVAADENLLIPWNGQPSSIVGWNQDHTLASAIKNSVVWYYQELATRIGAKQMQHYLDAISYGNRDISGGITKFWLHTSLEISAKEQVELLRRLYQDDLPFLPRNMAIVRRIIIQTEQNGVIFSGKTGSAFVNGKFTTGWFVGAVEKDSRRYFFAVNIEAEQDASGVKARNIAVAVLKSLGILPVE